MTDFFFDLYNLRILLALTMLAIATVYDVWKREVNDVLWVVFGSVAIVMIIFESDWMNAIVLIGVSMVVTPAALVMWRIGFLGGADAICLIVLGALVPTATFSNNIVTPFTTLTNAALISTILMLTNAVRNMLALSRHENIFEGFEEMKFKKAVAIFLGYRAKSPRYGFCIERTENKSKKLDLTFHNADKTEFCTKLNTWVTPAIPFMVFITAGFVVQLIFGDVIFNIIQNMLGV